AIRVLDRPSSGSTVTPAMAAGMRDSVWTMEGLLARPARPVSDQRPCVALSSTLSRDTTLARPVAHYQRGNGAPWTGRVQSVWRDTAWQPRAEPRSRGEGRRRRRPPRRLATSCGTGASRDI